MKIVRQFGLASLCLFQAHFAVADSSFVSKNGELSTSGSHLINEHQQIVQLRGMSLFWSQWAGAFYNKKIVDTLAHDWHANVVRAALGVEKGGYLTQPKIELKKVETVIEAAIAAGIYVIVDFHSHDAQEYQQQSIEFFSYIAKKYGHYPNVIYEIYNEPDYESWSADIKPYAETLIKVIRSIDPQSLIIVGTPTWSQRVDMAAMDPIKANNIAYTIHFYAGTHNEDIRQHVRFALDKGIALFATEWGMSKATGNGGGDDICAMKFS